LPNTLKAFLDNYDQHTAIYRAVLEPEIQTNLDRLKQTINGEMQEIDFKSEDWAKIVYSFIAEFHRKPA
jgi:hypothetical protein